MRRTLEKIKERKAITLIALVVTIVVLLILAGVTISLLLDENGIIAKSKYARLENRALQVEDEIGMWKQNNFINKESDQAQEEANTILESLITRKLLTEDEIDREQEIITIKKKDGGILKQISYSQVTINISKNPETEKSGAVLLTVDSVKGITIPNFYIYKRDWSEVEDYLKTINKEQKKEMIKEMLPKSANKEFETDECDTLEKALNKFAFKPKGYEILDTEEKLWNFLEKEDEYEGFLIECCIGPLVYHKDTNTIEGYTVTNPDGETSNTYAVAENGTYTFKVKDNVTGKTYTKKVEVTNIDKSLPALTVTSETIEITLSYNRKEQRVFILLKDLKTNEYVDFEKAYILFNNKKIEITPAISTKDGKKGIFAQEITGFLYDEGLNRDKDLMYTNQTIILEKDNKEYISLINMGRFYIYE